MLSPSVAFDVVPFSNRFEAGDYLHNLLLPLEGRIAESGATKGSGHGSLLPGWMSWRHRRTTEQGSSKRLRGGLLTSTITVSITDTY